MKDDAKRRPAEVFSPAEYIKEEMEARGWSVDGLAVKMFVTKQVAEDLLAGTIKVDNGIATKLGLAFKNDPRLWVNLQEAFDGGMMNVDARIPWAAAAISEALEQYKCPACLSEPGMHRPSCQLMSPVVAIACWQEMDPHARSAEALDIRETQPSDP